MSAAAWWRGFRDLFFPSVCLNCRRTIDQQEALLCLACERQLTLSDSWQHPENSFTDRMAGRLPLVYAASAYTFRDGTVCQQLIHALKYHNRPDIGVALGRNFGALLSKVDALQDITGIVPVPIHRKRRHERGYNQAEAIAQGLAEAMEKPVYPNALRRTSFKGSQTKRSALDRLENVRHSFAIGKGDFAQGHLLLVDDVMTTGATLDFCGNTLLEHHAGLRLSMVTLALAER